MAHILSIHSFRGGTGKSNTAANVAALLALDGRRVAVVDTDIQSPGIHVLFGLPGEKVKYAINDYLFGDCEVAEAIYDMTHLLGISMGKGKLYLLPSSIKAGEIARVLREGYDVRLLTEGFRRMIVELNLDVLVIDTHPGLNEETLLSFALANTLVIVMRPDQQDFEGTGVTVQVARQLEVPNMRLVVNKVPPRMDPEEVRSKVEKAYGCPVAAILTHVDELMGLASSEIFALKYPDHPLTAQFRALADQLIET